MPESGSLGATPGDLIVAFIPVALWLIGLAAAGIAIWLGPRPMTLDVVADRLIKYLLIFPLGVQSLWAFVCHVFIPEEAAASIGWEPSPFQYEVGVANLGIGLAALYAAFQGFQARAAAAVMAACFLGGAAVGHLRDIAMGDNLAPGNAGPILYTDILTPIVLLVLLLLTPRPAVAVAKPAQSSLAARIGNAMGIGARRQESPPRVDDEWEQARKSMREQIKAGPRTEILPPANRQARGDKPPRRKIAQDPSKF